ncbi:MAG: hypothetical protein ACLTTO_09855 [Lachnospiraceae bacterium]
MRKCWRKWSVLFARMPGSAGELKLSLEPRFASEADVLRIVVSGLGKIAVWRPHTLFTDLVFEIKRGDNVLALSR